jgi:short-subunit dehydrogenase
MVYDAEKKSRPVVVITGASAGVGRATALRFAKSGAKIGLIARDAQRLKNLEKEIANLGSEAISIPMEVTNEDDMFRAADEVEGKLGPIDIWINDAMVTIDSEFIHIEPKEFARVTDVCYHGFVYGTMAALSKMYPRNKGVIVLVGSALAYRGIPLQSAYCGAKHAIQGFSESLRSELMHNKKNIFITMVQMPALNTPQFMWCKTNRPNKPKPVAPIFQPEVAAEAIFWSAHHPKKREIIVGAMNTVIVWGNKFFPGFGDWYLAKTCYKSQMTNQPVEENRKVNLWTPVEGPFKSHGTFDKESTNKSLQLYLVMHPWIFRSILVLILIGIAFLIWL